MLFGPGRSRQVPAAVRHGPEPPFGKTARGLSWTGSASTAAACPASQQAVPEVTRSQHAIAVLDALFGAPIFSSAEFYERSAIPKVSGAKILKGLEENDVIQVLQRGAGRRASVYASRACLPSPREAVCEYSGIHKPVCVYQNPDPVYTVISWRAVVRHL